MSNPLKTTMTVLLAATLLLAGCEAPTKTYRCIEGELYESWGDQWVKIDGKQYPFRKSGPLVCAP